MVSVLVNYAECLCYTPQCVFHTSDPNRTTSRWNMSAGGGWRLSRAHHGGLSVVRAAGEPETYHTELLGSWGAVCVAVCPGVGRLQQ